MPSPAAAMRTPADTVLGLQRKFGNQSTLAFLRAVTGTGLSSRDGEASEKPSPKQIELTRLASSLADQLRLPTHAFQVRSDDEARRVTRAQRTRGWTENGVIYLDPDHFSPTTSDGIALLGHELVHIAQARLPRASREANVIEAEAEARKTGRTLAAGGAPARPRVAYRHAAAEGPEPQGSVSMSVSMDGLRFEFPGAVLQSGATRPQIMAMILRRLLGQEYKTGVENTILAELDKTSATFSGGIAKSAKAQTGDRAMVTTINVGAVFTLAGVLIAQKLHWTLTDAQVELLNNAVILHYAWAEIRDDFPNWYTEWIFKREMAQQGALLAGWRAVSNTPPTNPNRDVALNAIEGALLPSADLLEIIRRDVDLALEVRKETSDLLLKRNREGASVAYALLFQITLAPTGPAPEEPASVDEPMAASFLRYIHSQPKLAGDAYDSAAPGHEARVALLGRFGRFWLRTSSGSTADEKILQHPATANTPAWKGTLSSTPQVMPPLYDAALETDHAFTMQLQWGHWTDAMAVYSYMFEFIRVPESALTKPPDLDYAAGAKPSFGKVMNARLARASRYNAADLERIHQTMGNLPFGETAHDLVETNNALRVVGVVIRTVLEKATEPKYVVRYVFPKPGMYIVRCRAVPVLDGDEELRRMPSVAYLPIVARDPDEMAVSQVKAATQTQFAARLRLAEIQAQFDSPFPPENAEALRREMEDLQAMLLDPKEALDRRKAILDEHIALLQKRLVLRHGIAMIMNQPEAERNMATLAELQRQLSLAGGDDGNSWDEGRELSHLREQRDSTKDLIKMHAARTKDERGLRFVPTVSFVSDLGHSLQLSIEMFDRGEGDGVYQVYMSDITTPDSGEMLGTAPLTEKNPRLQAIKNGLKKLLENSSDYGRGRVAVEVDGEIYHFRIEAGTGRMLSEAMESTATIASLAAILAAPFTDGASLYLLLPLGAVGAIPSAYRLYQRHDERRLRLDFAAVMDVVNIVGGVLGLAQAATPLRCVRMGKVLMVMGLGADGAGILMMGAGIVIQLDALSSLPEHERAARMLEILGNAMLQIGIQAGGMVAHARYQSRRGPGAEGKPYLPGEEPGFHRGSTEDLPPPAATTDKTPNTGDKTTAGNPPPSDGSPPPKPLPKEQAAPIPDANAKASPEALFDKLGEGIDRKLPPPLPPEAVKKPAKPGEYQRGLMTADAAYAVYNKALAVSKGREVAIYHNPETGEYRIMVGSETGVHAPEAFGWNALLHYHPNKGNVLTFRLPAPQDFRGLMLRYVSEGGLVREFIEFDIPGVGRGRTEYGIDPGNPEPFYVRIHQPDGSSRTVRFAHDGHYTAYWGERTVAVPKDSPVYDAMIRDIEAYIRSIRREETAGFGPDQNSPAKTATDPNATKLPPAADPNVTKTTVPPADPALPPGGKTVAGSSGPAANEPMQTGMGDLTDNGVAYLRSRFKKVREPNGKYVELASLTDAEIRDRFPNQSAWLEAVVLAEARADWLGRATKTDFVLATPNQNFEQIAAKIGKAAAKGKTGHSVHEPILSWSVWDFVNEMLAQNDPTLTAAYNACENHPDPAILRRWKEFKTSTVQGDMSGFFLGTVGKKRPDLVEVMLSKDAIHVTDASFAYGDPIHNFKSAFYKVVMERLVNVKTVTSADYRAPLKQTPIGP
ncbi:MAG: DUF4157 domain-containing protein [Nibricoccus sp.]